MKKSIITLAISLLSATSWAQGINPITPPSNWLLQVLDPANANPSNFYTTSSLLGTITSGTTATRGCTDTAVLESRSSLVTCDGAILAPAAGPVSIGNGGSSTPQLTFTPNSGNPGSIGMANGGSQLIIFAPNATQSTGFSGGQITTTSNGVIRWTNSTSSVTTTIDTTFSRSAAGVAQIGTTTSNALGNLLISGIGPGTIYSAAGTAVPACAAGTNGWRIIASDITTATYRTAYVSGGTNTGQLLCVNGTGWLSN